MSRYYRELDQAREMYERVLQLDYNQLRANGARKKGSVAEIEGKRPIANQLKTDLIKNKKQGAEQPPNDVFEGKSPEERDAMVLSQI